MNRSTSKALSQPSLPSKCDYTGAKRVNPTRLKRDKVVTKQIAVELPKTYYIVMKIHRWENMKLEQVGYKLPFPVNFVAPNNHEVGYLPVFDTKEAAIKCCGDEKLVSIVQEIPNYTVKKE